MYYPCEECFRRYQKEYAPECDLTCDYAKVVKQKKEMIHKIALKISNMCGSGCCPAKNDCKVYSDKACIERIINWLEEVTK